MNNALNKPAHIVSMTAVFMLTVCRQRTQPKIYEERSVQGQINQIIHAETEVDIDVNSLPFQVLLLRKTFDFKYQFKHEVSNIQRYILPTAVTAEESTHALVASLQLEEQHYTKLQTSTS